MYLALELCQQKSYAKKRQSLRYLADDGNEVAKKVYKAGPGRPRMENEDALLEAIKEVSKTIHMKKYTLEINPFQ